MGNSWGLAGGSARPAAPVKRAIGRNCAVFLVPSLRPVLCRRLFRSCAGRRPAGRSPCRVCRPMACGGNASRVGTSAASSGERTAYRGEGREVGRRTSECLTRTYCFSLMSRCSSSSASTLTTSPLRLRPTGSLRSLKSASIVMRVAVSTPTCLPVIFATINATRRQCAGVRPAWVVPSGRTTSRSRRRASP